METRKFKTFISGAFVDNDYVLGRITGVMDLICKENPIDNSIFIGYGLDKTSTCVILVTKTTQKRYDKFIEIVKAWYPQLHFLADA